MSAKASLPEITGAERPPHVGPAYECPRLFLGNRFVYTVISPRAGGLVIGLNLNPDKFCNFDCVYCEVNRNVRPTDRDLDIPVMATELEKTLLLVRSGAIRVIPDYGDLSPEMLRLRHVAFSGDGEPTLCLNFADAVQAVVRVRALQLLPFFKLVLLTNGTWLDLHPVQDGLKHFARDDEIWIKLDAGTQAHMDRVNRSEVPLGKVMENIRLAGQRRPIVIQSLFPLVAGVEPTPEEIDQYILRLRELKDSGARITLVQIYSATRPAACSDCRHLPLQSLARICRRIKTETGLSAEVF